MPSQESQQTLPTRVIHPEAADGAAALARACSALWLATLSLMTAFMQTRAPAHRQLLARRIARNLYTLWAQECFAPDCRDRFGRLAKRWDGHANELQPRSDPMQGGQRLLDVLRRLTHHAS